MPFTACRSPCVTTWNNIGWPTAGAGGLQLWTVLPLVSSATQWKEAVRIRGQWDHPKDKNHTSTRFILQSVITKSTARLCGWDEFWTTFGYQVPGLKGIENGKCYLQFPFSLFTLLLKQNESLKSKQDFFFHSWVKVQFMVCIRAGKGNHHIARSRTFIERCCNILVQIHRNETVKLKNWEAFDWTAHRKGTEHMISHHYGDVNCRFSIYLYLFLVL